MTSTTLRILVLTLTVALGSGCVRTAQHRGAPSTKVSASTAALPAPANQLDRIRRSGTLRVGVSNSLPWAMTDRNGELVGFEVDVARRLAEDLGVALALVPAARPNIVDDLLEDRFDLIVSRLPIEPRTALLLNFSDPYNWNTFTLVARRGRSAAPRGREAFDRPDVCLGVRRGSLGAEIAAGAFPRVVLREFDDERELHDALVTGRLDGLVLGSPAPEFLRMRNPGSLVLPLREPLARRSEAFGVAKGDPDMLAYLNAWIRYQEETGWLAERRRYWFESFRWEDQL